MAPSSRRITFRDLVSSGLLRPGSQLIYEMPRRGERFLADVTKEGKIRLSDGSEFETPSGAATGACGAIVNGWRAWRDAETGMSLDQLRFEAQLRGR